MAKIEVITLGLDLKNKEDLDLFNKAMSGEDIIIYDGKKYIVGSVLFDNIRTEVVLCAAEQ